MAPRDYMKAEADQQEVSGVSTPGVVVLGIQGSPRRGGNTDHMLEAALEGARKCGANTSVLVASEAGMRPCCGCNQCIRTGQCVQLDSGSNVYARLDTADAIIVASPVYFASVPAVLKIIIDRLQPYWARRFILGGSSRVRRAGGILLAGGGGDPYGFSAAEATLRSAFAMLELDVVAVYCADGLDAVDDFRQNQEYAKQSAAVGTTVAQEALRRRLAHDSSLPL